MAEGVSQSYTAFVVEHFKRPNNRGRLPNPNAEAEGVNPLCGDRIRIECSVSGARVSSVMFSGDACAICVASASVMTDRVRGMSVPDIMALHDDATIDWIGGEIPVARRRCALLPLETLRRALAPHVAVSICRPIVLAAGAGRRFGGDKLLALVDGVPLVRLSAEAYAELCGRVTVVVSSDPRLAAALSGLPVDLVVNPDADEGIASSIRAGVSHDADRPAIMIALADEPRVDRTLVADVMGLWHERQAPIVAPRYNGEIGHPVLFDRRCYADLLALEGDRGARGLILSMQDRVRFVDVDRDRPVDVDTVGDLEGMNSGTGTV
jgi:molybdenum cofactor cytidylyltransferase